MLIGFVFVVFSLLIQFSQVTGLKTLLSRAEGIIYDLRLKQTLTPSKVSHTEILILDLDEKTMAQIGWPWPRKQLAQLVHNLADAGVAVIAFDIIFSETERNAAQEVLNQLNTKHQEQQSIQALVPLMDGDQHFIESFGSTDVLLGYILQHDPIRRGKLPEHVVQSDVAIGPSLPITAFSGYVTSLPKFHAYSAGEGFINSSPDPDGFLRKSALLYRFEDKLYPSLALETARLYTLAETIKVKTQPAGKLNHIEGVMLGNELIPTDAEARVLIPYKGQRGSYPYISAIDVLNNTFSAEQFEGAVVFVGTSAIGLSDLRATPVGVQYPGVEVHANVLDGLLNPTQLKYVPDWWEAATALYLLFIGILLSIMLPQLGPRRMALTGLLTLVFTITCNVALWNNANMALPIVSSLLLISLIVGYNISIGFFYESRQRQQIKSIFNQYVPPAHIDKMLSSPEDVSMDGERKELTVLFSDIRSFTNISESLNANQLKSLLNRYFDPITECIFNHQGTIDKYVGDMVMAFWGAPLDDPNHPEHAVEAALSMLAITAQLRKTFHDEGLPEVYIGIGINTGTMNVGDMGSTFRRAYTVLGDAVNLGSRLEGLTKFYGVECLVSEFTAQSCASITFRLIDRVKVKGKVQAVKIYEPLDPALGHQDKLTAKPDLEKAYACYLQQDWQQAERRFSQLYERYQETLYRVFLDRIQELKQAPLPHDWDGSFTHTSK
ncbi:adenylate/guanylate cyclase domain-containing protein [Alteromonas sp. a30]|nr:adenylate/guanylate cyclase domain-containing protein [Alteromonas sp. a30]